MRPGPTLLALLATGALGCMAADDGRAWRLVPAGGSPLPGVGRANAIGVGDFDRDGRRDVVVLGGDPGELFVLRNWGAGRFAPSGVIAAGRTASGLAVGDLDGDGAPDVAVSHHDDFEILVLLSGGDGALRPAPWSPVILSRAGTPHSHNLALADVNADGRLDLVQAQADENAIFVLLGDGGGGFSAARGSPLAAGKHPYTVVVHDLDGDGAADVAAPDAEGEDLTVWLGDGTGGFAPAPGSRPRLGGRGLGLAAGDVDGDGRTDLVANHDDQSALELLLGDGSGGFRAAPARLAAPGRCFGQAVADLDLDGIQDVAAPCMDEEGVSVWLGRRDVPGAFRRALHATPGTDSQVMAVADLDGDGLPDVATAGWERKTVSVLLGRTPEGE